GRCLHGCPHDAKQSTAINYLKRAAGDGASIFAHAEVTRVIVENGRATGVVGRIRGDGPESGRRFRLDAKRAVIVAASAVQSPALLQRSKIRHAHLGRHFMAHPGTTVMGVYPQRVDMWSGASQGYEVLGLRDSLGVKLESINVPPEVVAARLPGAGARLGAWIDKLPHIASWAVAVKAQAEGRVRPSRLFGTQVSYSLLDDDIDRLRRGMRALAEMHFHAGAREVLPGVYGLPEVITSID